MDALTSSLEAEQARVRELDSDAAEARERGARLDADLAALREVRRARSTDAALN